MAPPRLTPEQSIARFWAKVDKSGACWLWTGARNSLGYGYLRRTGRDYRAHCFSYVLTYGPIPPGLIVRHKCDTPLCVKPDHLELGTYADNSHDMISRGRSAWGERSHTARLTPEQVREIRQRYAAGQGLSELGRIYHCNPSNIQNIVRRRTWRNLS